MIGEKYHIVNYFRPMLDNVTDMVFFLNFSTSVAGIRLVGVNGAACVKLGYSREELLALGPEKIAFPADPSRFAEESEKLASGAQSTVEMNYLTKSGGVIPAEVNSWLVRMDGEELVFSVARDVSERKRMEKELIDTNHELRAALKELRRTQEQLVQSEKLAGIGQLAAGVAHEINNPLGYITSNVDTAKKYIDKLSGICNQIRELTGREPELSNELLRESVRRFSGIITDNKLDHIINELSDISDDIDDGLKRINKIVTGLKTFARVEYGEGIEEYDLNAGIRNTLLVAHNELKHHAEIEELLGNIPCFPARGGQINQVLLNLILNSVHAIRSKDPAFTGLIRIKTYCESESVYCEIEDNGTGIAQENTGRIFQPFFTTKPVGQGTGLGLSIAYDIIVNKHHGDMRFESTPGEGTRFILRLPLNKGNGAAAGRE